MNTNVVSKLCWYSTALMILTSIHHIYGAIIYETPWRLHVIVLSVPVILATWLLKYFITTSSSRINMILFWLLLVVTLVPSIGMIGVYEGIYNHLVKNIMFFSGASKETLVKFFPPPTYELPNDFWFELTGIAQGILALPLFGYFSRMILQFFKDRGRVNSPI